MTSWSYGSYTEFWPDFLRAHSKPLTRAVHYFGMTAAIGLAATSLAIGDARYLLAALLAPYVFGWASHALVEGNQPVSFRHPLYSMISAIRMYALWLTGAPGTRESRAVFRHIPLTAKFRQMQKKITAHPCESRR